MKNIAILYGGRSYEHDISIITAIQVMTYIDLKKYKVIPIYLKEGDLVGVKNPERFGSYINFLGGKKYSFIKGGIKAGLTKIKIDCALLCTHGGEGENGVLQGVLEYYDIPYSGPDTAMSATGMNKWISKAVFNELKINTLNGYLSDEIESIEKLGYPVIVKPVSLGSSIGIEIAHNKNDLETAINTAKYFDDSVIIEKALVNRIELNCAAVKYQDCIIVSAIEKPVSWKEYLTFQEKYNSTGKIRAEKELPAKISDELTSLVKEQTEYIYKKLGLKGVVRVDYLYSLEEKILYINEINTIPGSLAYYLFSQEGIPFTKLIDILIEDAITTKIGIKKEYKTEVLMQYVGGGGGTKNINK